MKALGGLANGAVVGKWNEQEGVCLSGVMRRFVLNRKVDESGVSGTGVVAEGVQFANGKCVVGWRTDVFSVAVYDSVDDVVAIHGHNGLTELVWLDEEGGY